MVGETAQNINKKEFITTARHLRRSKSFHALKRYLDAQPAFIETDPELLQIYANACDALDDPYSLFDSLSALWEIDKSRFQTLEWMIWLTKRLSFSDLSHILVEEHARVFPSRHKEFLDKIRLYKKIKPR